MNRLGTAPAMVTVLPVTNPCGSDVWAVAVVPDAVNEITLKAA